MTLNKIVGHLSFCFLLLAFSYGAISANSKPIILFILDQDNHSPACISDSIWIKRVMSYVSKQKGSDCMADYGAYAYYSKDSFKLLPIWENCCEKPDTSMFSFIKLKQKEHKWRIWKFILPVVNNPSQVIDAINKTDAFFNYYECDTLRLSKIVIGYTLKGKVNRQSLWKEFEKKANLINIVTKTEVDPEPYVFNVKLYFSSLKNLAAAKEQIEKDSLFQVHDIQVPTIIEYPVFVELGKEDMITKELDKIPVIPYKIGD